MNLKKYNELQCELIKSSGLAPDVWIKSYSAKFREIINSGITCIEKIRLSLYS